MGKELLGSVALLVAVAGSALAQTDGPGLAAGAALPPAPAFYFPAGIPGDVAPPALDPEPLPPEPPEPHDEAHTGPEYLWFNAEYLLWIVKKGPVPVPLVTMGSATDVNPGALGQPGTTVLFGNQTIDYGNLSGARFTLGLWMDPDRILGLECNYFFLAKKKFDFQVGSSAAGSPVLARPVIVAATGQEQVLFISFPGVFAGGINVSSSSELWGSEINLVDDFGRVACFNTHVFAGFRFLELAEDLKLSQTTSLLPLGISGFNGAVVAAPATLGIFDTFSARNQFYGFQLGGTAEYCLGHFYANLAAKVAIGVDDEKLKIDGSSSLTVPGTPTQSVPGGLLAVASNIGKHDSGAFAVVPEVDARAGYGVTRHINLTVGYTWLLVSSVLRPGEQIDRTVNPTQVPTSLSFGPLVGPARPGVVLTSTSYWAQGLDLGLEIRY